MLINVVAYGRAGHIPDRAVRPASWRANEPVRARRRCLGVSLRGRRNEFTVTRVISRDPRRRRLPAEAASVRLIGQYDRLGSVRFNVRPCFQRLTTDAEDPSTV